MARPRKPTTQLEVTGAFVRNPGRRQTREHEPKPTGPLGEPPAWLSATGRKCFQEIERTACAGVLTSADSITVAVAAALLDELQTGAAAMPASRIAVLRSLLVGFGMDPAARARLQVRDPGDDRPTPTEISDRYFGGH